MTWPDRLYIEALYRYSQRLHWASPANSFGMLLQQVRASGKQLFDLTISNPTDALPGYPHAEIAAVLSAIPSFTYQPDPFGHMTARTSIAARMKGVSPEDVALTASTSEAYSILFKLLADPGDEVLVPAPSYPLFGFLAELEGVKLRPYRLDYDGSWYIDFDSLEMAISPRTRALILVNPNNPTGSFLKAEEFDRLRRLSLEHSLPVISDEVFQQYGFEESAGRVSSLAGLDEVLSFSLNGLSKSGGMPQMKLGWISINGPVAERERARIRLELILDTYLSVGAPVQLALDGLLAIGDAIRGRIRERAAENLDTLGGLLQGSPLHALHTEGGWSAIVRVPNVRTEEQWISRLLLDQQVIVQPGYFFDMPHEAFLVVSPLTDEEAFSQGVKRILDLATRW